MLKIVHGYFLRPFCSNKYQLLGALTAFGTIYLHIRIKGGILRQFFQKNHNCNTGHSF